MTQRAETVLLIVCHPASVCVCCLCRSLLLIATTQGGSFSFPVVQPQLLCSVFFLNKDLVCYWCTMGFSYQTPSNCHMLPVSLFRRLLLQLVSASVAPSRVVSGKLCLFFSLVFPFFPPISSVTSVSTMCAEKIQCSCTSILWFCYVVPGSTTASWS